MGGGPKRRAEGPPFGKLKRTDTTLDLSQKAKRAALLLKSIFEDYTVMRGAVELKADVVFLLTHLPKLSPPTSLGLAFTLRSHLSLIHI